LGARGEAHSLYQRSKKALEIMEQHTLYDVAYKIVTA